MRARIAIAVVGVLVVAGLVASTGSAQLTPRTVVVTFSGEAVTLEGADGLPAGATRFEFRGQGRTEVAPAMVSLRPGKTLAQFRAALRTAARTGPAPLKEIVFFEAGGATAPGQTYATTIDLRAGRTYIVLSTAGNPARSPLTTFTVGEPGAGVRPVPAGTVALYDFAFAMHRTLPRQGVVRFENRGRATHFAVAFRLRPGASRPAAVKALMRNQERRLARLVAERDTFEPLGIVSPGTVNDVEVDFRKPGNWVLACFMSDGEGGTGHNELGMAKAFKVR